MVEENKNMIPQCRSRIADTYTELKQLLLSHETDWEKLQQTEEFKAVKEVMSHLPSSEPIPY